MSLLISFIVVLVSAVIILLSAHFVVRASVQLAQHFKLSDALIGMTILSIGTSIPEIMTHIVGSVKIVKNPSMMNELSGLVIGTNIGSDIFQQTFLLSFIALVGVVIVKKTRLIKDVGGLIGAAVILWVFALNGFISRLEGFILLAAYFGYLYYLKKKDFLEREEVKGLKKNNPYLDGGIIIGSFAVMAFAASFMVDHSTVIIEYLGISASFFGIIILGIAAAFPELSTSLIAVLKKKERMSAGVLIGSNITNPMFALGAGAVISSYTVPQVVYVYDLPIKIVTAIILYYVLRKHTTLKKSYALGFICVYFAYLFLRNVYFPVDF